jgi:chemotaxis protein methyltransferase CheR
MTSDVLPPNNKASFFRELEQFRFLQRVVLPSVITRAEGLRVWSAGCSTGEEPYTIAMVVRESLPDPAADRTRILASDPSFRALRHAAIGEYRDEVMGDVPSWYRARYFTRTPSGASRVGDSLRCLVRFAQLNLVNDWPEEGEGPFDVIVCRNVLRHVDHDTQERLVRAFTQALRPGGFLFISHAETLSSIDHALRYIQPAIYIK